MKILHYISDFSLPSETFIYDLIIDLEKEKEIKNFVLTHNRCLENERIYNQVKIIPENASLLKRGYYKFFHPYELKNKKKIIDYINNLKPDVIHAHFGPNGIKILNLLLRYKIEIPLVITFHGTDINSMPILDQKYFNELKKINNCKTCHIIAHTEFLKKQLIKSGVSNNINIINNCFNPSFSNVRKVKFFKKGNTLKIVNTSRLINWKGHQYLLEGFEKFARYYPDTRLTFIGDGEEKFNLMNLAKKLNIEEKIVFLGSTPHHKIPEILAEQDIYIQSSIIDPKTYQQEGMPISILEAIAIGLPVIVTNTGGMPEEIVYESNYSHIVNEKSSEAIFQKLVELFDNGYLSLNNEEYASFITERYSTRNMIEKIKVLYKKIQGEKN